MPRYYEYVEDAFRPSQAEGTRVKDPKTKAVVSRGGAAPKGYYMAGTQTVSNKAGEKTYNIFRPLQIEQEEPAEETPVETAPAEEPQQQEQVQTGPNYEDLINQAMANIPSLEDITDALRIQNEASEARIDAMNRENRKLMLIDARNRRAESRTPNLQIRGAGETPTTAGTQGFRRRKDQFRITPFQGIGGIMSSVGQVAQGAANQMVNI